jgi:hypothetical protein
MGNHAVDDAEGEFAHPSRGRQRRQGYGLDAKSRKLVEDRAMELAREHYEGEGLDRSRRFGPRLL